MREERLLAGNHEFPTTAPARSGLPYATAYLAGARPGSVFHHRIDALDVRTGKLDSFDFGVDRQVCEPIFAPRSGADAVGERDGHVLTVVAGPAGTSALAVFDAARIADGPVALAELGRHVPVTFHGWWRRAGR